MTWMIFLMALHPEVQQKVREEIHQKIGDARKPSAQDEEILPYTTATIKEMPVSLRINGSFWCSEVFLS